MERIAIYKITTNGEEMIEIMGNTHEDLERALDWAKEAIKKEENGTCFQICTVLTETKADAKDYETAKIDFIAYEVYSDRVLKNEYGQMVIG